MSYYDDAPQGKVYKEPLSELYSTVGPQIKPLYNIGSYVSGSEHKLVWTF
jgi:hypothetical protein